MRKPALLTLLSLLLSQTGITQIPTVQDCLGAIPVCQEVYSETNSPTGNGNYPNEINTAISCTAGELNSIWYTFTVNETGNFGFVIIPNNPDDDYDWSLFDITNANCADIGSNPSLQVSCNAAGGISCHGPTGADGSTIYNVQGGGCGAANPNQNIGQTPFNALLPVQEGNTYVLMVSNWSGSTFGYTLDFGLSSSSIIDNAAPLMDIQTHPMQCGDDQITVLFNEFIQCSSIDGSFFQLNGPGGPYTLTVQGPACEQGGTFEKEFTFTISPPIESLGLFSLEFVGDGATQVLDLCDNAMESLTENFTVNTPIAIDVFIGNDTSVVCEGQSLLLNAQHAGAATYLWQDGSTNENFLVTDPGLYYVFVTDACGTGADTIAVTYINELPLFELGQDTFLCEGQSISYNVTNDFSAYLWQNGSTQPTFTTNSGGLIHVAVANACGAVYDTVQVDFVSAIVLDLGPDQAPCAGELLLLSAENPGSSYLWSTGSQNSSIPVSETGTYSVEVTTLCETLSDEISLFFVEEDISIELGPDTLLCQEDVLLLDIGIPGASYVWQDGSTESSFWVTETGYYSVQLTTGCGVLFDDRTVGYVPPVQFELPSDAYLCFPPVRLSAATAGQAQYRWQDGTSMPTLTVENPGTYTVEVSTQCESVLDTVIFLACEHCDFYFPNVFSPNDDGFNDFFQVFTNCELFDFRLQVFNRWGGLVFEARDPQAGWDGRLGGKLAPSGVYTWRLDATVVENGIPRMEVATGGVTLLR